MNRERVISLCKGGVKVQKQLPTPGFLTPGRSLTKLIIVNLLDYSAKLLTVEHENPSVP